MTFYGGTFSSSPQSYITMWYKVMKKNPAILIQYSLRLITHLFAKQVLTFEIYTHAQYNTSHECTEHPGEMKGDWLTIYFT